MLCLPGHANTPAWPHATSPVILTTGAATTASLHNSFVALQQRSISGTVTGEDGEGLPGASVVVKGTTVGTTTDVNGAFNLNVPPDAQALVISYIGYTPAEVPIQGRTIFFDCVDS